MFHKKCVVIEINGDTINIHSCKRFINQPNQTLILNLSILN